MCVPVAVLDLDVAGSALDEATRVFEDLTARILVCTGTSKAPTTERRFIGTRLTQEPLPTFNWWLLGVDDYHSLYAHDHFEMRAQVVRAAGDTSGQRYAVTLTMQPRASDR